MRKLTDEEIRIISGGIHPAVIVVGGAVAAGTGAYLSGGSPGQVAGAAVMGGVSAGYGALASVATGASQAIYFGYSLVTGAASGLFTRDMSAA
ncbi:class IIb bacteriocin, lactobin A/cerein 7B family [Pseudomonas sp. B22129]|uniref:class IIb bacteriocin, lactobin A/cerein 7B family n=1 Tax=Pseudomonas sp. B22129 TaxID=3235111 RepID=UPI003783054E